MVSKKSCICRCDLYSKLTPFLQKALDVGAKIVTGDRMFLWQAFEQAKVFTERDDVPVKVMEKVLSEA